MIPKNRPTPPGDFIKEDILKELGLTQVQLADILDISYQTLNQVINEKQRLTADIALRLSQFTQTSPEMWLNLQLAVELWDAYHAHKTVKIDKIQPYNTFSFQRV